MTQMNIRGARLSSMLVVACVAGVVSTAPLNAQPFSGNGPEWVQVELAPLVEYARLDGQIEAVQQSTVSAQTSGTVVAIPFDVDDVVDAGELIVSLDDTEQRARANQAEANLSEAQAALTDARQRLERIGPLVERGVASQAELDQANNQFNAAQARLSQAEAAAEQAQEQLSYTKVLAPYGGIVTERHVEVGESVSPGTPLLSGFSLEALRVTAAIPQRYADLARQNKSATVTLDDGRVLETGEMTFFPYADPNTHSFRVRMPLTEPDGSLFPGMLVRVGLPVSQRQALWIPETALVRRGELRGVYVLDDNQKPRLRQIRTGVIRNGQIEVLSGLSSGERVRVRGVQ